MSGMELAKGLPIDLAVLLETRLLLQANSGAGKSWALRRLLEQTAPHVQQLIIDPEGEFATLREKYDYVIAAAHDGDAVASPQTAALLARRLLESGVSAVLDIYDLKAHDRQAFVSNFLNALVNAPRKLWHPVLVALDEAHVYCPQVGNAPAADSVKDVATRGRKRGLCLVAATQRLSKLHKDVAAELLNKMIGRTGLDVDVKRAADELGMNPKEGLQALRTLDPGEFYAYGPALCTVPGRMTIGPVATSHPKAGQRLMQAPPPASAKVRQQLAKLADLQKEAETEARTVEDLQARNADLQRQLRAAEKRAEKMGVPEPEVQARITAALAERPVVSVPADTDVLQRIRQFASQISALADGAPPQLFRKSKDYVPPTATLPTKVVGLVSSGRAASPGAGLTGPEQRILNAIAWMNAIGVDQPEQTAVAFLAGYTIGGGAWNNPRGSLRTKGYLEYLDGRIVLTPAGNAVAVAPQIAPTTEALHAAILQRLPGPETKLLQVLLNHYPNDLTNEELATQAGYSSGGGAFNNPRGRLRSLGLIEYTAGRSRARSILFPEKSA